ncbi:alanine dehydrogenase [Paenibacillus sp. FJAT-27812]|uniref:alanine dehydrogenase n=1 Tax=Paenibacillus sp. FJAT-27812 TaxID=1684143 RepID=UPI0006A77BBE|nr:alanine dehydrogenase [Paenibacillus sp. FJAT-27812]
MLIGIPKEIKNNENRVAITPAGVSAFVKAGHELRLETGAGLGSGFTDADYAEAGASIAATASEAWQAELVMKVKEPLPEEYGYFREGLILFTYLHLAAEPELLKALIEHKVVAIAYETIQGEDGSLPLLVPMSEVAGRMSIQIGAQFLERSRGGKGVLLGGVPGVAPAKVVIVGGGIVGANAAKMAVGLGADVTLLDINSNRLRQLDDQFQGRLRTLASNSYTIAAAVKSADLLIGAVLLPGAKAPVLVTEEMVKSMQPGSVIIDVAIDQGGSIQTIDRITTHSEPTYLKHNVVHYAVANMPGAVARTSTIALTNVTIPYALQIANKGYRQAALSNRELARGINVIHGKISCSAVAAAHQSVYESIERILASLAS